MSGVLSANGLSDFVDLHIFDFGRCSQDLQVRFVDFQCEKWNEAEPADRWGVRAEPRASRAPRARAIDARRDWTAAGAGEDSRVNATSSPTITRAEPCARACATTAAGIR